MTQCRNDVKAWRNGTAYRAHGRQGRVYGGLQAEVPDVETVGERDADGADPS
jgi:hypothetical protein